MAKIIDVCIWCSTICKRPASFDPNIHLLVCNHVCKQAEYTFRMAFSDKMIGERNYADHGINPNKRGHRGKKAKGKT